MVSVLRILILLRNKQRNNSELRAMDDRDRLKAISAIFQTILLLAECFLGYLDIQTRVVKAICTELLAKRELSEAVQVRVALLIIS